MHKFANGVSGVSDGNNGEMFVLEWQKKSSHATFLK